jgi:hypothetical protein
MERNPVDSFPFDHLNQFEFRVGGPKEEKTITMALFYVYDMKKQKCFKNCQLFCDSGGMLEKDCLLTVV